MLGCCKVQTILVCLFVAVCMVTLLTLGIQASILRPAKRDNPWSLYQPSALTTSRATIRRFCTKCGYAPNYSVTIVVARTKEDTSWLDVYLGRIPHIVYQIIDANAEHTTKVNKGNEAMPYLEYIIEHFDQLPDISVFSHGAM